MRRFYVQYQQNEETYCLGNCRCHSCAENAEMTDTHKNVVHSYVEYCAHAQTYHGVKGFALVTQVVVKHQRTNHKGAGDKHPQSVITGVGQDSFGRAQQTHEWGQKSQSQQGENNADNTAEEKRRRNVGTCFVGVIVGKFLCDKCSGTVSKHECHSLNYRL